jgi:hypothetical protein
MKTIFVFLFVLLIADSSEAQISRKSNSNDLLIGKTERDFKVIATSEADVITKKITDVMRPVTDILEKIFNKNPETYKQYQEEINSVSRLKTMDEKRSKVDQISKKYYAFVRKVWTEAGIDEASYQKKIKDIFPDNVKGLIRFGEFLTFQYEKLIPVQPYHPSSGTPLTNNTGTFSTDKPNAPGSLLCVDDNPTAGAVFDSQKSGAGVSDHIYYASNTGNLPCTIMCNASSLPPWGSYSESGITLDKFTIPGRFPFDSLKLKVTKNYHWKASAFTASILGCGIAYYYETPYFASALKNWQTEICICAPATFVLWSSKDTDKSYSSVSNKMQGNITAFGLGTAIIAGTTGLAYAGGDAQIQSKKWEICELR